MMFRQAWFIGSKDVSRMLRHKEALLWIFVMPFLFFYFIGTVTAGFRVTGGSADKPDPLVLEAAGEGGFLVEELAKRLEEQNFQVLRSGDTQDGAAPLRRLVVPAPPEGYAGFTEAVLAGKQSVLKFERKSSGLGADFDQVRVARAVYTVLADLTVAADEGKQPTAEAFQNLAAMPRNLTLEVLSAGRRKEIPTGYEQAIPGMLVMFTMLVLLTSGSILLVIERETGLLRRLASTPISRGSVFLGKWMGRMALALVQIAFAMLVGTVVFNMTWGETLPMLCLLLFVWAAFNASLGILLGNLSRSQAQMAGIGVVTTMILAALGGCWWPIEVAPPWMQKLALFLPTGWAMDAMHQLVNFGNDAVSALPHLLAMTVAALVLGWLGARTFRYQ